MSPVTSRDAGPQGHQGILNILQLPQHAPTTSAGRFSPFDPLGMGLMWHGMHKRTSCTRYGDRSMFVKIFQASGHDEIKKLEDEINEWSINQPSIKHVDTALAQVGDSSERYQYYVVSVWYT